MSLLGASDRAVTETGPVPAVLDINPGDKQRGLAGEGLLWSVSLQEWPVHQALYGVKESLCGKGIGGTGRCISKSKTQDGS